jgi:thioredoxin-like negative regulator of GroEL
VMAVLGGQLVDGFLGALPEAQVRQWLDQVLEVAEKLGLEVAPPGDEPDEDAPQAGPARGAGRSAADAGRAAAGAGRAAAAAGRTAAGAGRAAAGAGRAAAGAGAMPPAYAEARAAMERGDLDAAARAFETQLAAAPDDPVAKTGLAQVNLIRRVSSYDQARARRDAAEHPGDVEAQIRVADIDLAAGRVEEAFDRLLGVVRRTSGEERNQARAHLVTLFELLPPRDPQVAKARSTLSALLF